MSSEHLVHDVEKGNVEKGNVVVIRELPHKDSPWKCLSICSFLLLVGATVVFALLQFGAFGPSENQDSRMHGNSLSEHLPDTMKVQALRSGKPAVHAVASSLDTTQLKWTTEVIPSILKNGMKLNEDSNSLEVPSTGLYFVYSQVLFHKNGCSKPLYLTHSITRLSSTFNGEVELLKSIKSACENRNDYTGDKLWFESIYQGGVFELHQGDLLWSKTNFPELLDFSQATQIYFGVIAL